MPKIKYEGVEMEVQIKEIVDAFKAIPKSSIPKNIKNKIGIIIAVVTESDAEKNRIKNDLIAEINHYLGSSKFQGLFNLIEYEQEISTKITNRNVADYFLKKSKAHLIIYGSMTKRKMADNFNYVFRLYGMVRHAPIPQLVNKLFEAEFSQLLPPKIFAFPESEELMGFELTKNKLQQVIKYVIGKALFVSGALKLADELFVELHNEIENTNESTSVPVIYELKKLLVHSISDVLSTYLNIHYDLFAKTRMRHHILNSKPYLDRIKTIDPENYRAHSIRAIFYFFEDKIEQAIEELKNLNNPDITWHYSLGFLYAYKDKITEALKEYQKTFYKITTPNVYNDVDIFISEIIDKEPNKHQLLFFRGLANYKGRGDYQLAYKDFSHYLKTNHAENNKETKILAEKYTKEMKNYIGIQ